jgi:hypothetical protein
MHAPGARGLFAVVSLSVLLAVPAAARAQDSPEPRSRENQAVALGANAILGGITAGIRQQRQGSSFWSAFARGALGGGVTYAGKRVAGEQFPGAGFLGREVAAVGSSMVLNAAEGRDLFERVTLPIGPLRLYLDQSTVRPVSVRVDLAGALITAHVAMRSASFDWRRSLSAGAPVFIMHDASSAADGHATRGRHAAGVIQLQDDTAERMAASLAHEQVHVAQHDFAFIAWAKPIERRLMDRVRVLDLGLHVPVLGLLNWVVPYEHQPWEWEAHVLSNTRAIFW